MKKNFKIFRKKTGIFGFFGKMAIKTIDPFAKAYSSAIMGPNRTIIFINILKKTLRVE